MVKKKCPICGDVFIGRIERITCGIKCAAKWRSKTMLGLKHASFSKEYKICPICKKRFIPKRRERKTCSIECGHKLQSMKISGTNNGLYCTDLVHRACMYCGRVFRPQHSKQVGKFCSVICSDMYKIVEEVPSICEECGKVIYLKPAKAKNRRYCSRKCYLKNYNKRSRKVGYIVTLLNSLGYVTEEEKTFDWLVTPKKYHLYIDVFLSHCNIAIEYDGIHHFIECNNRGDLKHRQYLDNLKNILCSNNGIKMVRFRYDESFSKEYIISKLGLVV